MKILEYSFPKTYSLSVHVYVIMSSISGHKVWISNYTEFCFKQNSTSDATEYRVNFPSCFLNNSYQIFAHKFF